VYLTGVRLSVRMFYTHIPFQEGLYLTNGKLQKLLGLTLLVLVWWCHCHREFKNPSLQRRNPSHPGPPNSLNNVFLILSTNGVFPDNALL
jgi:hypothetical protein